MPRKQYKICGQRAAEFGCASARLLLAVASQERLEGAADRRAVDRARSVTGVSATNAMAYTVDTTGAKR